MSSTEMLQKQLEETLSSPIKFGETFLKDPGTHKNFQAWYPQKQILSSKTNVTYVCVDGNTEIIDPYTLRPTPILFTSYINSTYCFDFNENKVKQVPCKWHENGLKECVKLYFGNGLDLVITDDHLVFERKKGWVPAKLLKPGDQILSPSSIPIFGSDTPTIEDIEKEIEYTQEAKILSDKVFKYTENSLLMFFAKLWSKYGSFFNKTAVKFMFWNKDVSKDVLHLLLRIGVISRIDVDGNLFIDEEIDSKLFLHSIGVDVLITEIRSARHYETIYEVKKVGLHKVYDVTVTHPDHNFIANNFVVHNCVHRRAGKSYAMSLLAIFHAQPWQMERSFKIHIFAPGKTQIREVFRNIDDWINENPILKSMQSPVGNGSEPIIRTFLNGSTIQGHVMGISEASKGRKRGITADVVIVDEAQELTSFDWKVINPIISGDYSRKIDPNRRVKAYIAGTITLPEGQFYDKCKGKKELAKNESLIFMPLPENKDYTQEMVEETRAGVSTQEWYTEWMLEVGDMDTSVFMKTDVDRAFSHEWFDWHTPSDAKLRTGCVRYIGIDWDMRAAGTNIVVCQYEPLNKTLEVIYREEVPKGAFTYAEAVKRIPELMLTYWPNYVIMDGGAGEYQYQDLVLNLPEELSSKLIKKYMHNREKVKNPFTGVEESKQFKQTAVNMLNQKLQESKFSASGTDKELKEQLLTYKIKRITQQGVQYSSTKEHIIDGILFCLYGVWLEYENPALVGEVEPKRVVSKEESTHPWRDPNNIDPYAGITMDRLSLYNDLNDELASTFPTFGFNSQRFREMF